MPVAYDDPRRVGNDGPPDAKIVFLGEAPGENEDKMGRPFVGWSGKKMFDDLAPRANLSRDKCLVGNVIPVRPPNNYMHQLKDIGVDVDEEVAECRKWLQAYPRDLIICLGNTPLKGIVKELPFAAWRRPGPGIGLYRGSLLTNPGGAPTPHHNLDCDVYCMYHPAAINRDWSLDSQCKVDAKNLRKYLAPGPKQFDFEPKDLYLYGKHVRRSLRTRQEIDTLKSCEYFLNFLQNVKASGETFCFDIETYNETITVFGLATSSTRAISIPFTGQFTELEEALLVEAIRDLLDTPVPKITQNGIYDCTLLADQWQVQVRGHVYDTLLMHHCIYSELPHALAFLTSVYTDEPFFKQMAKDSSDANYALAHWEYNALDCACTYQAWEGLCKELTFYKTWPVYHEYYTPLSETLANVQREGFNYDKELREKKIAETDALIEENRQKLNAIVGEDFNIKSPTQMKAYVHGTLNLPKQYKRGSPGKTTLDKTARATLRRKYPSHVEFFDAVDAIAKARDLQSKYLGKPARGPRVEPLDPDGRFRASFNIAGNALADDSEGGAETGRLSSSKNCYRRGGNLQNQPKALRDLYIPDEGKVMWKADGQSAESFVVAWLSDDPLMMKILTAHRLYTPGGPDKVMMHENTGSIITGLEVDLIIDEFRELAKRAGHAFNYGIAPKNLAEQVNNLLPKLPFSVNSAKTALRNMANAYYGVTQWRDKTKREVMAGRTLRNIFGHPRIFFNRMDDNLFREAYAHVPQSSVGVWMNQSLIKLRHEHGFGLRDDVQILCQVHDEVVGQCTPEALPEVEEVVREVLERELPLENQGLPLRIPCSFESGPNWKDCA